MEESALTGWRGFQEEEYEDNQTKDACVARIDRYGDSLLEHVKGDRESIRSPARLRTLP